MKTFQIGETVVCYLETKLAGTLTTPDTTKTIDVIDPEGTAVVEGVTTLTAVAMNEDAAGQLSYDLASGDITYRNAVDTAAGVYRCRYKTVHGGKTTWKDASFKLEV